MEWSGSANKFARNRDRSSCNLVREGLRSELLLGESVRESSELTIVHTSLTHKDLGRNHNSVFSFLKPWQTIWTIQFGAKAIGMF